MKARQIYQRPNLIKPGCTVEGNGQAIKRKIMDCGGEFKGLMSCTRYKANAKLQYGPLYRGTLAMANYPGFDSLIKSGKMTNVEKEIISAMSENEGKLDAVQSYDSEIVSIGAMQKTADSTGFGQLPQQLLEFKLENPEKYTSLIGDCGWKVIKEKNSKGELKSRIYYKEETGDALKKTIRKDFGETNYSKKVDSLPLLPLIALAKDGDFQTKQVMDFVVALRFAIAQTPLKYNFQISDYIKSGFGKAVILDHHVNRPNHVRECFGESLTVFFTSNTVSKNPNEWGTKHPEYESKFLKYMDR